MNGPQANEPTQLVERNPSASSAIEPVTVDVTDELRWFVEGPPPTEIVKWFTANGSKGLIESRTDTYRLGDGDDTGVKQRFGHKLELKTRLAARDGVALDADLVGQLETWQRWSPAGERVERVPGETWVAVDKFIIKRRFDTTGREVVLSEANRAMVGAGCDVEIAAVEVYCRPAWSLAFAAFGPPNSRERCIFPAWRALAPDRPTSLSLVHGAESCSYPEWLAGLAAGSPTPTRPSREPAASVGR